MFVGLLKGPQPTALSIRETAGIIAGDSNRG
jgi:hypothetical protein